MYKEIQENGQQAAVIFFLFFLNIVNKERTSPLAEYVSKDDGLI